MKILNSINTCYQQQLDANERLKEKVKDIIESHKEDAWHYVGRIKPKESYALKIETGRVYAPTQLDDFFACMIVVENSTEIKKAIELVERFFTIIKRRPPKENFTHKFPESFPYDDLRLYVKLKPEPSLPPDSPFNELSDIVFEIQIKTFLQHAWTLATHDLIYKGEEISWAKRRVAYQIKAMLEHAELSIYEIEQIKGSSMLSKSNTKIERLNKLKKLLTRNWNGDALPEDMVRLSESVDYLLTQLNVDPGELQTYLNAESEQNRGTKTTNLPPYFIIVQTIINQKPEKISGFISSSDARKKDKKIVIPNELETNGLDLSSEKIIRF